MDFLEGRTSPQEEKALFDAFADNGSLCSEMEQFDEIRTRYHNPSAAQIKGFRAIRRGIHRRRRIISYAASVIGVAAVGAIIIMLSGKGTAVPDPQIQRICTSSGEIRTETLPDGSTVHLNSATTISFTGDFASERDLSLSGEAYFNVVSDPEHPFKVHVGSSTVTAKGTKFNVSAYPSDPEIRTVLVEGRVEFSNSSMSLTMRPGEVLSYGTATGNVSTWSENVNQHLSWMSGHLNYDRISLERLMVRLSSIYDMDIRYSPVKYADSSFRISLNTKEPIENVLQAIATLTPIEWQRDGNVISIKEK